MCMRYIIFIILYIFSNLLTSKDQIGEEEYEYLIDINGTIEIIKEHYYSGDHFFRNYIIDGNVEDNYGNYGSSETVVFAVYKKKKIIKLEWSNKIIFQNGKKVFFSGYRKDGVESAGVGRSILFEADETLLTLIGMKCTYAIKFFKNKTFTKSKCKIDENKKKVIENLS